MKKIFEVLLIVAIYAILVLSLKVAYGQTPTEEMMTVTQLINGYPTSVNLEYQSPNTIIIHGDLIIKAAHLKNPNPDELERYDILFNRDLWTVMDALKSGHGFQLLHIMTSGVGSVGNPTTIFIVMTK